MPPSIDGLSSMSAAETSEQAHQGIGNAAQESSTKVQQKRNRIQLSCTHCRHAKLKCDREKPCSQCAKRGRASLCTFPAPAKRKKPAASMQNRLKHLETLVKGVMAGGGDHISPQATRPAAGAVPSQSLAEVATASLDWDSTSKSVGPSSSSGQVVLGPHESTYVGATHWAAILNDVKSSNCFGRISQLIAVRSKKSKAISMRWTQTTHHMMRVYGQIPL